jgi:signal transduction histidine kinase
VLLNLLSNIEHHAYPGGQGGRVKIILSSHQNARGFGKVITVCDEGERIASEPLTQLFEPFLP